MLLFRTLYATHAKEELIITKKTYLRCFLRIVHRGCDACADTVLIGIDRAYNERGRLRFRISTVFAPIPLLAAAVDDVE